MSDLMKNYQIIAATCKVLSNIDWNGYHTLHNITNKDIQYIGEAKNIQQYLKRFIEIVKDNVLKNISNINDIKWKIKGFDDTIGLHLLIREVGKILEQFIKYKLTEKYSYDAYHISKHHINYDKTIIIEMTQNNEIILIANISVEPFI